jgi:hypothetical protein
MVWEACSSEPNFWLRWMECHPGLGGYFTLLGVIAAIWVGRGTIRAENKRVAARGRVVAYRLAPVIVMIKGEVDRARALLTEGKRPGVTLPSIQNFLSNLIVSTQIPADIFGESWTLPDYISSATAQLQSVLEDHARVVNELALTIVMWDTEARSGAANRLELSLDRLGRLANTVGAYCARISDKTVSARRRRARLIGHLPLFTRRWLE